MVIAPETEVLFPPVPGAIAGRLAAGLLIRRGTYEWANGGT